MTNKSESLSISCLAITTNISYLPSAWFPTKASCDGMWEMRGFQYYHERR